MLGLVVCRSGLCLWPGRPVSCVLQVVVVFSHSNSLRKFLLHWMSTMSNGPDNHPGECQWHTDAMSRSVHRRVHVTSSWS